MRRGDAAAAERIATAVLRGPGSPDRNALWIRGNARDRLERYGEAVHDFERLAQLDPDSPTISVTLGSALFKAGDLQGSIAAFDSAVALDRSLEPSLWQRGIAHYYARRLDDCIRQFETHRTVNPQDVENSVWHFLCVAAKSGAGAARERLIPVQRDSRVPMAEIFDLFAGEGTASEVLRTANEASNGRSGQSARFYAHLYIGLYEEALGNAESSAEHIAKAVEVRMPPNYMWQVARVHELLRTRSE